MLLNLESQKSESGGMWSVVRLSSLRLRGREGGNSFTDTPFFRTFFLEEASGLFWRRDKPKFVKLCRFGFGRVTGDLFPKGGWLAGASFPLLCC